MVDEKIIGYHVWINTRDDIHHDLRTNGKRNVLGSIMNVWEEEDNGVLVEIYANGKWYDIPFNKIKSQVKKLRNV